MGALAEQYGGKYVEGYKVKEKRSTDFIEAVDLG